MGELLSAISLGICTWHVSGGLAGVWRRRLSEYISACVHFSCRVGAYGGSRFEGRHAEDFQ